LGSHCGLDGVRIRLNPIYLGLGLRQNEVKSYIFRVIAELGHHWGLDWIRIRLNPMYLGLGLG